MLWIIAGGALFIAWYVVKGRTWFKTAPYLPDLGFFALIEPLEIRLWKKSETILASRLLAWGAGIVAIYDFVAVFAAGLDLTPLHARLLANVPPDMRPVVVSSVMSLIGALFEWLRRKTTKPLELVAVPEAAPVPPAVAAAVAEAEAVKEQAVATVERAKQAGTV